MHRREEHVPDLEGGVATDALVRDGGRTAHVPLWGEEGTARVVQENIAKYRKRISLIELCVCVCVCVCFCRFSSLAKTKSKFYRWGLCACGRWYVRDMWRWYVRDMWRWYVRDM